MKRDERPDPYLAALKALEADEQLKLPGRKLPDAENSHHIWMAKPPAGLAAGSYLIEIQATDMFGQTDTARRILRVE